MANISKKEVEKIVAQAKKEINFARNYKQMRTRSWKKNEDMYYGRKIKTDESRANVDLGKMQGFVHTILSKIKNPLIFKYGKKKEADLKKANRLNSLRESDASDGDWDIKDMAGKKQAVIYGRAIYCYYADSYKEYRSNLEPVDVYDFLIDPSAGGLDIEKAFYMGRYGIVKTREDIIAGGKLGIYIKEAVKKLTSEESGNATEITQEESNKANRYLAFQPTQKEIDNKDKYKFWEWYTTYKGTRYYLLMNESGDCLECTLLTDKFASNLFPFWTWAAFLDLTEFWSPSYSDYVREIFMAQSVSINQMLDNAEQVNKPMKGVISGMVENVGELKFRKDGYIRMKNTDDINKALRILETPSIDTPIRVYETLEVIQQSELGVTAGAKGVSTEDKVGIYEGNMQETADRFGLLNLSYSFGYKRFAKLYEKGVDEHLIKKVAVEILGPDGVEVQKISRKDIRTSSGFKYIIQSSDAETNLNNANKANKLNFLTNSITNPAIGPKLNPQKVFETGATIMGYTMDEIKEFLDVDNWGDAELMSEAARDIERIFDGENIKPNEAANIAYKQKIVNWMKDHKEDIDDMTFFRFSAYVKALEPYVIQNTVSSLNEAISKIGTDGMSAMGSTGQDSSAPAIPLNNTPAPKGYN